MKIESITGDPARRNTPMNREGKFLLCQTATVLVRLSGDLLHPSRSAIASECITQRTSKYEYILIALPQEIIAAVIDFIRDPAATNKCQEFKRILIGRNSLSESSKLDKILSNTDIDDRKLWNFYRSLLGLGSNAKDIKELIKLADDISEVSNFPKIKTVASTSRNMSNITIQNLLKSQDLLCETINRLPFEVGSMKARFNQRDSTSRLSKFDQTKFNRRSKLYKTD
uniref:DUF7041 domain-containing protein n=1 Tax=Glossina austeni TaxID=7395 RepID=A0A1A9VMS9_GLOAU